MLSEYEAVRLFSERARAARSDFELNEQNASAVAQICRRLDGIPLAIELAAARVKVLSPQEIAARIDDRFNLLTTGSRTALPRQQTLRALLDWSHDLLSGEERLLFRRLAVFNGGRTLQAVENVCSGDGIGAAQVLDLLTRLIDKSLLFTEERSGTTVYRMLDTIRHYAHDKLKEGGETDRLRGRHAEYYMRFAETAEPEMRGAGQLLWLDRFELKHNNLRAALEWSSRDAGALGPDKTLRLASSLFTFWSLRGYWTEGREWLSFAQRDGSVSRPRASALVGLAELTALQDGPAAAAPLYAAGLEQFRTLGDDWGVALASALSLVIERDPASARELFKESLALAKASGDAWLIATAYHRMAIQSLRQKDVALARSYFEHGLEFARRAGDRWLIGASLSNLGEVARVEIPLSPLGHDHSAPAVAPGPGQAPRES